MESELSKFEFVKNQSSNRDKTSIKITTTTTTTKKKHGDGESVAGESVAALTGLAIPAMLEVSNNARAKKKNAASVTFVENEVAWAEKDLVAEIQKQKLMVSAKEHILVDAIDEKRSMESRLELCKNVVLQLTEKVKDLQKELLNAKEKQTNVFLLASCMKKLLRKKLNI